MPEVFLKALTIARNLGHNVEQFTTATFDMIRHYRPSENVVRRPTHLGGQGFYIVGHHEFMIPAPLRRRGRATMNRERYEEISRAFAGRARAGHRRSHSRPIRLGPREPHFAGGAGARRGGGPRNAIPRRRGECRAQPARIHRPRLRARPDRHRAGCRHPQAPADRRRHQYRRRAAGGRLPDHREDAHHRAAPAGGAGRPREQDAPFAGAISPRRSQPWTGCCPELDAIILEDYGKGFIQQEFAAADHRARPRRRQAPGRGSRTRTTRCAGTAPPS